MVIDWLETLSWGGQFYIALINYLRLTLDLHFTNDYDDNDGDEDGDDDKEHKVLVD